MKKIIWLIVLWMISVPSFGQDLVITKRGDSIYCKINRIESDSIYLTYLYESKDSVISIPISDVSMQLLGFKKEDIGLVSDNTLFRLALHGGYSYMLGKVPNSVPLNFKNYYEKLRSGYHFGGDFSYFMDKTIGLGFSAMICKSSGKMNDIYAVNNNQIVGLGIIEDKVTASFFAPTITARFSDRKNNNAFLISASVGYLKYKAEVTRVIESFDYNGKNVGFGCNLGYDYRLIRDLWLGFQVSLFIGKITSYEMSDGINKQTMDLDKEDWENLNRIEVSVGLRFGN